MISSDQYNVSTQNIRNLHIKINLLNFSYQTIDSLEGNAISGNITVDANADVRRTCQIQLVVTNSTFEVKSGGKIFLDRLIQIYVGVDNIHSGDITWFNEGIYLINQPTYQYDATTNTLSFAGLDLMSKMTGARNGYLVGTTYEVPQGSDIRGAIIAVLQLAGFTNYVVETNQTTTEVPITLDFDQGKTQYDILCGLRDIEPFHQIYFDVDGVFHYDLIPSGQNENVVIDDSTWIPNVISESIAVDFEGVKNSIEVYGQSHDIEYYSTATTVSESVLSLTIAGLTTFAQYDMIGFTTPSAITGNIQLNVNATGALNLVDLEDNIITALDANTYYVAAYQVSSNNWLFLGHQQAYAVYKDTNPQSPFYIGNPAGEIKFVCSGGEYENIQFDELALERAQYEIYLRCRLNDTVQLTTIPIYYLDVHQLASYTPKANNSFQITYQYMIQSISFDLSETGVQTIALSKYYPAYPVISS